MDEQRETVTSYDPQTGEAKQVTVVLDHHGPGGMYYTVESSGSQDSEDAQKGR